MTSTHAPNVNHGIMCGTQHIASVVRTLLLLPNESNVREVMMNWVLEPV